MLTGHEVTAIPDHPNTQALPDEVTLAGDLALQADLVAAAYATGRDEQIDRALNAVTGVRRMQKSGILDWFREGWEPANSSGGKDKGM